MWETMHSGETGATGVMAMLLPMIMDSRLRRYIFPKLLSPSAKVLLEV